MPETPKPQVDNQPQVEQQPVPIKTKVKPLLRYGLPFALTASLLAGCASPGSNPETSSTPPGITNTENPNASLPSIGDFLNKAEADPTVRKSPYGYISATSLAQTYKETDYVKWTNRDEKGEEKDFRGPEFTAPVLEIRYNKDTDQLVYLTQSPEPLGDEALYSMLQPLAEDDTIFRTAFQSGQLDRIGIRLSKAGWGNNGDTGYDAESVPDDRSDPAKGIQKSVFFYLPSTGLVDRDEYTFIVKHEGIHALKSNSTLGREGAPPDPAEREEYAQLCLDIRDFAVDDAEENAKVVLRNMEFVRKRITDPAAGIVFDEVMTALKNGEFNALQQQPGTTYSRFSEEVPECRTIGPWEAYYQLLERRGFDMAPYIPTGMDLALIDDVNKVDEAWASVIMTKTIYEAFTESAYEYSTQEHKTGHPQGNWDELTTSTTNVALKFPHEMRSMIRRMPPDRAEVARSLVSRSLQDLKDTYPAPRFPSLNRVVDTSLAIVLG